MNQNFVLQIQNYQIIQLAQFEFIPGLNVIVGESNNGKSSVLRAIETAIFNVSRPNHVRLGSDIALVGINYKDSQVIWRRDNKSQSPVSYKIDGKVYQKLGRNQVDVVSKALGIQEVELDGVKLRLNFQRQMSYPFLLDKSPAQLFKFIVQSAEEDNLMVVLDDMKQDLNSSLATIKSSEAARDSIKEAIIRETTKYDHKKVILPVCESVFDLDRKVNRYSTVSRIANLYEEKQTYVVRLSVEKTDVDGRVCVIDGCVDKADGMLRDAEAKRSELSCIAAVLKDYLEQETLRGRNAQEKSQIDLYLSKLDPSLDRAEIMLSQANTKILLANRLQEIANRLNLFYPILQDSEKAKTAIQSTLNRINAMGFLGLDDSFIKYYSIHGYSRQLLKTVDLIQDNKNRIKELKNELQNVDIQLSEFDICPFCESKLEVSYV